MQHIQDNEFDRLFKDQLSDSEVEPSVNLWNRIEPQLAKRKSRRSPYYWAAAATVLIALSAGLLFTQNENQPMKAQQSTDITVSKVEAAEQRDVVQADVPEQPVVLRETDVNTRTVNVGDQRQAPPVAQDYAPDEKKSLLAMQPVVDKLHHNNTTLVQKIEQPAEQGMEFPAADVALADISVSAVTNAPVAAVDAITETTETIEIEQITRPRIRNAGDLVNFVVDKIDKREQKIVEFRTDEDENSSLVAINIGPFKINQRKSK